MIYSNNGLLLNKIRITVISYCFWLANNGFSNSINELWCIKGKRKVY